MTEQDGLPNRGCHADRTGSDKQTALGFLAKRVPAGEFTRRAKFNVFDGVEDKGRLALEVWEDSFVRTYKVANLEAPKGQRCSG